MKPTTHIILLLLYSASKLNAASTQESLAAEAIRQEIASLKQRLTELEKRLDAISQKKSTSSKLPSTHISEQAKKPAQKLPSRIVIQSDDQQHQLQIRGLVQVDTRSYLNHSHLDTFLLRRARIILDADIYKHWHLNLHTEFAGSSPSIIDANINAHLHDAFQIQAGRFKTPFGLEFLQPDPHRLFNETSLASNLVPGRDIGIQVHGTLWNRLFEYQFGLFNGTADGANAPNQDTDSHREMAARFFFHPLKNLSTAFQNFGLGIALTHGEKEGASALPSFRTDGHQSFLQFQPWTSASGTHTRFSPQLYAYWKNFALLSEFIYSEQELADVSHRRSRLESYAWHTAARWIITGEEADYLNIRPEREFKPWGSSSNRGWGALELALRVAQLDTRHPDFSSILLPGSSTKATAWGVGLNWYLNDYLRIGINYLHTHFDRTYNPNGQEPRREEQLFLTRFQFLY